MVMNDVLWAGLVAAPLMVWGVYLILYSISQGYEGRYTALNQRFLAVAFFMLACGIIAYVD